MAEISGAALQRVRLVPLSEHAPVGPVTAPPDQFIEHPGFNMLKAELLEFARCIRDKQPYPVDIEKCCTAWPCSTRPNDPPRSAASSRFPTARSGLSRQQRFGVAVQDANDRTCFTQSIIAMS